MLTFVSGCATITRGSTEAFVVEADPAGADVALSNGLSCRTRCSLTVKRKDAFIVKITRDGYEPVEASVTSQTAGGGAAAMAGNVIFGGLIGVAADVGTGATQELKPNPLRVTLAEDQDVTPAAAPAQPAWILAAPPPVRREAPASSAQAERVAPIVPRSYPETARAEEQRRPAGATGLQRMSESETIPLEPGATTIVSENSMPAQDQSDL